MALSEGGQCWKLAQKLGGINIELQGQDHSHRLTKFDPMLTKLRHGIMMHSSLTVNKVSLGTAPGQL